MNERQIIYIPGKNPKPPDEQHRELLWRTLLEGVRRAVPEIADNLCLHSDNFKLIAWNYLYYHNNKDISSELPWIEALINQQGPTERNIHEAHAWRRKWNCLLYTIIDYLPFLLHFSPESIQSTAKEITHYFQNKNNIACEIRDLLKQELRPVLASKGKVLVIGHSLGSVIAYDTLWELSHLERLPGKIDLFLTIGSPLGMNYVQRRLMGNDRTGKKNIPPISGTG